MRKSIRTRLSITFIGLAIIPLLLVGIILAWQSVTTETRQALNLQREVARRVATEVTAFFQELESELRLVSKLHAMSELERNEQQNILKLLMTRNAFENLFLLDAQGQEQSHLSRLGFSSADRNNFAEADEFVIPQTSGQVYYSPVWFMETTGEPLITIAVPLLDARTGLIDGVLVSTVRIKKIWNVIADIRVSPGQSVYIVDAQNTVVAHRNPSVVLRSTRFDVPERHGIQPGLTAERAVLAIETLQFGTQEFHIIAEQTIAEAFALAINMVVTTAVLIAVTLVIAGSLGFLSVRQIVRPIQTMAITAQAISAGDLSQQVQVTGQDELGVLADAFNSMTTQLRSLIDSLEQRVAKRTAQLEAAQAELLRQERLATLGKLTATVSHEIRNPLATIRTSTFAIDRKTRDKGLGVERALERIERNITRCDNIIAELLDYTRMPDLKLEPVFFDPWLKQLLTELTVPEDITLSQELVSGGEIALDPERFRRVMINLVDNACQAMLDWSKPPDKPLVLSVQSEVMDQQLRLSIVDTGPGIPPDVLPHIFEPLYSTRGFGVGLGLPVVREIMKQHNGKIEISSEVGKGTQAILWLPLLRQKEIKDKG